MSEIALYMTAVAALEDLCFRDQSATIPGYPDVPFQSPSKWSLLQYNVYLEVSSEQVRYAIWGIQLTTGAIRKGGFWPVIGRCFWDEHFAGRVDFANKQYPLPPEESGILGNEKQGNATNHSKVKLTAPIKSSDIFLNSTAAVDTLDAARLTIVPTYRGDPLSPRAVFGTAINIMVLGAENGPETYCIRSQQAEVEIIGENDAMGEPLLKYKSVIRAMSMLTSWMVAMNRFGEIDVEIQRNAILIGRVRIKNRRRSTAKY